MSKICPCANPPGNSITCADDQIGICGIIDGELIAGCFDLPLQALAQNITATVRQTIINNWVLARVTGEERPLSEQLTPDDFQIIKSGEYKHPTTGDVVRFSIPNEEKEGTPEAEPMTRYH